MKLRDWFALRGPGYVRERGAILLDRYGLTPEKAARRVESCVTMLAEHGCPPTLPTPGRVVDRHPAFIRHLQDAGAEIAVHSYDHLDLAAYPAPGGQARKQLSAAARAFARHGIEAHGFRCPYLRCPDDLLATVPPGLFEYSSNEAIWWDVVPPPPTSPDGSRERGKAFEVLKGFYRPAPAERSVCTPWRRGDLVEIPLCVPDDLQIYDGLRLGPEGLSAAWRQMLLQTHARGELFVLIFHPELAEQCRQAFVDLLHEAAGLSPPVWLARLRDVSAWWREKAGFSASVAEGAETGLPKVTFECSPRATILARNLTMGSGEVTPWYGAYCRLTSRALQSGVSLPPSGAGPRPLLGLSQDVPKAIASYLEDQGYILDTGPTARQCGVYLDRSILDGLPSNRELVDFIEASPAPLVRYWRWPDGARSALAITGDLDALSLWDYASRVFV